MEAYLIGHDSDIWTYVSTGRHSEEFITANNIPAADVNPHIRDQVNNNNNMTAAAQKKVEKLEGAARRELIAGIPHEIYVQIPKGDKVSPHKIWLSLRKQLERKLEIEKGRGAKNQDRIKGEGSTINHRVGIHSIRT